MLKFTSQTDLSQLNPDDPAQPVISLMIDNPFSETNNTDPGVIALMEPDDIDHPLTELSTADDISLSGVIEQGDMFLVVLQTDYGYGIVLVIPDEDWLSGELRRCIEQNLYN